MSRKEYLQDFFSQVESVFGMDISKSQKGVRFALGCLRKNLTVDEALSDLEKKHCLIRLKEDEEDCG